MNFNFKKLPPFKWFVLQNFPFIEADFDAITYYQLLCKIVEYLNKVIDENNAIGEQTENLTNAFNELQSYVEHYFDNLDVQEEINNKLDEMASSGDLERIFSSYLNELMRINVIKEPRYKLIAHRGASADAPENTTKSFEIAGLQGFWGCETDIQKTSDGVFVCMHDGTIDRMTNGSGNINQLTYENIESFNIDSGTNVSVYNNLKVPTFEEYLKICIAFNMTPIIELKTETLTNNDIPNIFNIIKNYGLEQRCIVISFGLNLLQTLRNLSTKIKLQYLVGSLSNAIVDTCVANNMDVSVNDFSQGGTLEYAHQKGIEVGYWTITNMLDFMHNQYFAIDYFTTNSIRYCVYFENYSSGRPRKIFGVSNLGIEAYSNYDYKELIKETCIVRPLPSATGENFVELANLNFEIIGIDSYDLNRCFYNKLFKVNKNSSCIYGTIPTGYRMTIRMYDENLNQLADTGWYTGTQITQFSDNTKYILFYFAKENNSNITEYDIELLNKYCSKIRVNDDVIDYSSQYSDIVDGLRMDVCSIQKIKNVVHISMNLKTTRAFTFSGNTNIVKLPEDLRPSKNTYINGQCSSTTHDFVFVRNSDNFIRGTFGPEQIPNDTEIHINGCYILPN